MINSTSTPVGYLCRNRVTGELFPRVGTEALPGRSEIIAVVVEGVATFTAPHLEKSQVTQEALHKVGGAIKAGSSNEAARRMNVLDRVEDRYSQDWAAFECRGAALMIEGIALQLDMGRLLEEHEDPLDEEWCRKVALLAYQHAGERGGASRVRRLFRQRFGVKL